MIKALRQFIEKQQHDKNAPASEDQLKLASAALLVDMMYQDDQVLDEEIAAVKKAIQQSFSLNRQDTEALFDQAVDKAQTATDYHEFTAVIARNYTLEQKINVIEYLWTVAYADQEIDVHEEHMVRRIAELIYVPHSEFIKAKHRVIQQSNE